MSLASLIFDTSVNKQAELMLLYPTRVEVIRSGSDLAKFRQEEASKIVHVIP